MKILVLGGTGAMGTSLVDLLSKNNENDVIVTTRQKIYSTKKNLKYVTGNAMDFEFIKQLINEVYDAIIDYMVYEVDDLENRLSFYLTWTKQYFFFSSCRCFADSNCPINEKSSKLIDACNDTYYLNSNEYAIKKCREEELFKKIKRKNWTIVRPYITYNINRLQLGTFEKEQWLKKVLCDKEIIFPMDIGEKYTTITYGEDVSKLVIKLIGNKKAYGESINITTSEYHKWNEILQYYKTIIENKTGKKIKIKYINNSDSLSKVWKPEQIKYDRLYNRIFSNDKLYSLVGEYEFKKVFEGLEGCVSQFIENPTWIEDKNWRFEGWYDRKTKNFTRLSEIKGVKSKIKYILYRFLI